MRCFGHASPWGGEVGKFGGTLIDHRFAALTQLETQCFYNLLKCIHLTIIVYFLYVLLLFLSPFHFGHLLFSFRKYVLDNPSLMVFVKSLDMVQRSHRIPQGQSLLPRSH